MRSTILLVVLIIISLGISHAQISHNITLLGQYHDPSLPSAGNTRYNEVWGYVDCELREYAILGSAHYVHFFNLEDPTSPQEVASFTGGATTVWRDMKTYRNRAYSVCDNCSEGLMIFDLSQLPNTVTKTNQTNAFFSRAHNIFIDEEAGWLYVAGSNTMGGGVIILDLNGDPDNPTLISNTPLPGGYFHDIYVRDNIGYCSHGNNGYWVYDFSDPVNPNLLGTLTDYPQSGYNHASWLSPDGQYAVMADETFNKGLKILDVSDLTDITVTDVFRSALLAPADTTSIAHNPFIRENYVFASYYHDGVQVFDMSDPYNVQQVAWYDTYPANTNYNGFRGCWGVYAFLPSGTILGSDMSNGLFVLSLDSITLNPILHPTFPDPAITLTGDNPICEGESVLISVDPSADAVEWFLDGVLLAEEGHTIEVQEGGWYKAKLYNEYCEIQSDSIELQVIPLPDPVITPTGDPVICEGGSVFLSVDPSATAVEWYFNGELLQWVEPVIQVQEEGWYYAILFNQFCEIQTNSIEIQVIPYPDPGITLIGDPVICEGESVFLSVDTSATAVEWYLDGELLGWQDPLIEVQEEGLYYAILFNQFCEIQSGSIGIQVIPLPDPEIILTGDSTICEGDSVLLSVDPSATTIVWFLNGEPFGGGEPQIEVQEEGWYSAILFNQFCETQTDSLEIQVIPFPNPGMTMTGDSTICEGDSVLLSVDTSATTIEWYLNGEELEWTEPQLEVQEGGWYSAILFNDFCEIQSDSLEVQVIPFPDPEIALNGDSAFCEGNSVILSVDTSATALEWYLDGQSLGWEEPQIEVQEGGWYSAILFNQFCETQTDSLEIQVIPFPDPEMTMTGDSPICEGDSVLLSVDTSATTIEWYLNGELLEWEEPQIEVQEGGWYSATLFNDFCEIQSDSLEIQVLSFPDPEIALTGDSAFCEGNSVLLSVDTSATAIEWYLDGELLDWEEPQIEVQTGGWYSASLFNQFCETQTDSLEIQVIPFPDPGIVPSEDPSICEGNSVLLSVDTSATTIEWYFNGELLDWEEAQIEVQEGGWYSAILFNQFCETQTDSLEVQVIPYPEPNITLTGDSLFCEGNSVLLSVDTTVTTVEWYLNGQSLEGNEPQVEVQEGGWYSAILFNQFCEIQTDSLEIQVIPFPDPKISPIGNHVICEGGSVLLSVDSSATSIEWYFNGELLDWEEAQIEVQEGGWYSAILLNQFCETQTDSIEVLVYSLPNPEITLTGDTLICEGESVLLSADTTVTAAEWYLDGVLLGGTEPQIEVQEGGWYSAIFYNEFCEIQADSVALQVYPLPNPEITVTGDLVICEGESVLLSVDPDVTDLEWYHNGIPIEWDDTQIDVQDAGWYTATLYNEFCEIQADSVELEVQSPPEATLSYADTLACLGESILLDANEELESWQWYLNGAPIGLATESSWSAVENGEYSYSGQLGPCTVNSDPVSLHFFEVDMPILNFENDTLFSSPGVSYQWFLNGVLLEGATESFYIPEESGFYTVLIVDENGCEGDSEPLEVQIINATTQTLPPGWKIYPNPASEQLTLEFPGNTGGAYVLYDLMGRILAEGELQGIITRVGVSNFPTGIYPLEIRTQEKTFLQKVSIVTPY